MGIGKNGRLLELAEIESGSKGIEIARQFGISSQQYYKMKQADNGFRFDRLAELCNLQDVSPSTLGLWIVEIWGNLRP